MNQQLEVPPFINTVGDQTVKKELYQKFFEVKHLGNIKGTLPVMGNDFHETNEAYAKRLRIWWQHNHEVLFYGWTIKDLKHFQIATNADGDTIQFDFDNYTIITAGREFIFPTYPVSIDDFVNDCKRIGLKLFWNPEIIDKFGTDRISSSTKIVEYNKIFKEKFD